MCRKQEKSRSWGNEHKAVIMSLQEFVMGIKEMPRLARFIPKIMLAITVTACDEVYRKIACWLNDMGKSPASKRIQTVPSDSEKLVVVFIF